ncbi:hypothetical protein MIR68_005535 [Amoeboaphelidium protococcarum]|nr:hypothetical protein MIR68_005535 [Amoeboaphelidium protococcarum]
MKQYRQEKIVNIEDMNNDPQIIKPFSDVSSVSLGAQTAGAEVSRGEKLDSAAKLVAQQLHSASTLEKKQSSNVSKNSASGVLTPSDSRNSISSGHQDEFSSLKRQLSPQNVQVSQKQMVLQNGGSNVATVKRVRPIQVAPPPGLLKHTSNVQNHQQRGVAPNLPGSYVQVDAPQQHTDSNYQKFIKLRAVSGALASDWSVGRVLPEVPRYLSAELASASMSMQQMVGVHAQYRQLCQQQQQQQGGGAQQQLQSAHLNRVSTQSSVNVSENVTSQPQQLAKSVDSVYIPPPLRSKIEARLTEPLSQSAAGAFKVSQFKDSYAPPIARESSIADQSLASKVNPSSGNNKRRLAPTKVTAQQMFSLNAPAKFQQHPLRQQQQHQQVDSGLSYSSMVSRNVQAPTITPSPVVVQQKVDVPAVVESEVSTKPVVGKVASNLTLQLKSLSVSTQNVSEIGVSSQQEVAKTEQPLDIGKNDSAPSKEPVRVDDVDIGLLEDAMVLDQMEDIQETIVPVQGGDEVVQQERPKISPPPPSDPERRLAQRQKQIDIGKNTPEYRNYISIKPNKNRRGRYDPQTPDKHQDISKRNWEGQMKVWRRKLHMFDNIDAVKGGAGNVSANVNNFKRFERSSNKKSEDKENVIVGQQ